MLMGQSQVVQSLCQDSLFRIGGNFQEEVIWRRAPMEEDFEKPVGELARLNQFRLQGPPAPHLPDSAEVEDAIAVFLNQPLAAFVVFVVRHAPATLPRGWPPPQEDKMEEKMGTFDGSVIAELGGKLLKLTAQVDPLLSKFPVALFKVIG